MRRSNSTGHDSMLCKLHHGHSFFSFPKPTWLCSWLLHEWVIDITYYSVQIGWLFSHSHFSLVFFNYCKSVFFRGDLFFADFADFWNSAKIGSAKNCSAKQVFQNFKILCSEATKAFFEKLNPRFNLSITRLIDPAVTRRNNTEALHVCVLFQ